MLTTLATLKARLSIEAYTANDDLLLTNFIAFVSGRFERDCNRIFPREETTFEFDADRILFIPPRFPIESVSAWHLKTTEEEGFVEQTGVEYLIASAGEVRCMLSLVGCLGTSQQRGRVTYTGGYVLPGTDAAAGQAALPDELQQACVEQCAYLYQNRARLGLSSVQGQGGVIQNFQQVDLLPNVKSVLKKYERWSN